MNKHWYLVASLPFLRFGEKSPLDADGFRSACIGWLTDDEMTVIQAVLGNHQPPAGSAQSWWAGEVQLRDALVRVRAKARGADAARFLKPHDGFSATIEKRVADALIRGNPMEQEQELDRVRWVLAEEIALADAFGFPALLAFAIKLRIAERWAGLEEAAGQAKTDALIEQATTLENEQETAS